MAAKFVVLAVAMCLAHASVVPVARVDNDYTSFAYDVADPNTGDFKSQSETRVGGSVAGQYSLLDSDGTRRTVDYTADDINGFNAVVRKDAGVIAAPVVAAAPAVVAARTVAAAPVVASAPVVAAAPAVVAARTIAASAVYASQPYVASAPVYAARQYAAPYAAYSAPLTYSAAARQYAAPYAAYSAPLTYSAYAASPLQYAAQTYW